MLRFLYNRYRSRFYDLLIEDFYGTIPKELKEPTLTFMADHKDKLEKFFTIQAYHMQRRSIMDGKNADVYKGILVHIRSVLVLVQSGKRSEYAPVEEPKKAPSPLDGVKDFVKLGKERIKKAKKEE